MASLLHMSSLLASFQGCGLGASVNSGDETGWAALTTLAAVGSAFGGITAPDGFWLMDGSNFARGVGVDNLTQQSAGWAYQQIDSSLGAQTIEGTDGHTGKLQAANNTLFTPGVGEAYAVIWVIENHVASGTRYIGPKKPGGAGAQQGMDANLSSSNWRVDLSDGVSSAQATIVNGLNDNDPHVVAIVCDRTANLGRALVDGAGSATISIAGYGSVGATGVPFTVGALRGNGGNMHIAACGVWVGDGAEEVDNTALAAFKAYVGL